MKDFKPAVGDNCSVTYNNGATFTGKITYLGSGVGCFQDHSGQEYTFKVSSVTIQKLLSEEEKIYSEMTAAFLGYGVTCITKNAAMVLINAGYRKVRPTKPTQDLSIFDFINII